MQEVLPGIYQWSWFSQEKGYDFNGHLISTGPELVMIDPPPAGSEDRDWMVQHGPICHILLTNRDHVREAQSFRELFSAKVMMHEQDAALVDQKMDGTFRDQDRLPGGLMAIHIPNNKSPGETAFLLSQGKGVLFLGDALIGKPTGQLNLMPPEKYPDVTKAREGIRVLLKYNYDAVLVGDGTSLLAYGKQAVEHFLQR